MIFATLQNSIRYTCHFSFPDCALTLTLHAFQFNTLHLLFALHAMFQSGVLCHFLETYLPKGTGASKKTFFKFLD